MTTAPPAVDTYAGHSDSELEVALEGALSARIPVQTLAERARALPAPGAAEDAGPFGYGVQYESHWADYPTWEDRDDWEEGSRGRDLPLRFTTVDAAWAWCAVTEEKEHRSRYRSWQVRHDRWVPRRDLYERRVQALKDAGLWDVDGGMCPLLVPAGPGREPRRGDATTTRYRVVADSEMDNPVPEWGLLPG